MSGGNPGGVRYLGIDDNRLRHLAAVGRRAEALARDVFGWSEEKCREMFVLGFLHDVGYEYAETQADHEETGAEILRASGYHYWREVRWHGIPSAPYSSDELLILNIADLEVDAEGNAVSVDERLGDIARRYGQTSPQYLDARRLSDEVAQELRRRGIDLEL